MAEKLEGLFPFALHGADVGDLGQEMDPAALSAVRIGERRPAMGEVPAVGRYQVSG